MKSTRLTRSQRVIAGLLMVPVVSICASRMSHVTPPDSAGPGIYRAASLARDLHLCDRDWKRSDNRDVRSLAVIRAEIGIEPVVVDPRPFAPCPPGPCTMVAAGPCHTVIYVRVAEDGYVAYALRGGP